TRPRASVQRYTRHERPASRASATKGQQVAFVLLLFLLWALGHRNGMMQNSYREFLVKTLGSFMATKYKVLIVEDDEDVRDLLRGALEKLYQVVTAPDGKSGFEVFCKEKPDVLLTDVFMPTKDGLDLIKEIRSRSQIPIVVESGGNLDNFKSF